MPIRRLCWPLQLARDAIFSPSFVDWVASIICCRVLFIVYPQPEDGGGKLLLYSYVMTTRLMTTRPSVTNTLLSTGGKFQKSTNGMSTSNKPFFDSIEASWSSWAFLAEELIHKVPSRQWRDILSCNK